jgi:RNA polymerase sigma-70 factor (ECF subfamily)
MPNRVNLAAVSDVQLIAATLQGNSLIFGTLVQRYWNMTTALALSKIHDPIAAEDIAQESFLKAYSQLHKLRNPSRFAGWLSKIVDQQCANLLRTQARNRRSLGHENTALEASNPAFISSNNPGLTKDEANFVRRTVSKLPEKFRKLIIMRFVVGLSTPQIARQLGKRQGTVRVQLHRAYKILRKDLAPILEEVQQL